MCGRINLPSDLPKEITFIIGKGHSKGVYIYIYIVTSLYCHYIRKTSLRNLWENYSLASMFRARGGTSPYHTLGPLPGGCDAATSLCPSNFVSLPPPFEHAVSVPVIVWMLY